MTEKRFYCIDEDEYNSYWIADTSKVDKNKEDFYDEKEELYQIYKFEEYLEDNNAVLKGEEVVDLLNTLNDENEQLKKGMIEVVDRYIRNVEHNPPSSARTYLKVKGALVNVREGLRDLLEDLE